MQCHSYILSLIPVRNLLILSLAGTLYALVVAINCVALATVSYIAIRIYTCRHREQYIQGRRNRSDLYTATAMAVHVLSFKRLCMRMRIFSVLRNLYYLFNEE